MYHYQIVEDLRTQILNLEERASSIAAKINQLQIVRDYHLGQLRAARSQDIELNQDEPGSPPPSPTSDEFSKLKMIDAALCVLKEARGESVHIAKLADEIARRGTLHTCSSLRNLRNSVYAAVRRIDGVVKTAPGRFAFHKPGNNGKEAKSETGTAD